ncbi:MAG: DinB family protein [Chloroflexi bacterium]|nr:DinB family protein [Chloroflexota bacterium]
MKKISADLGRTVNAFYLKYKGVNDKIASKRPQPNEWSLKEIIGHLVNSVSNNQQRFLGLQFVNEMVFPEYQKYHLEWMDAEKFNEMKFDDLFLLWKQYNILIGHIIENIHENKLDNYLTMSDGRKNSLKKLVADYVSHLKNHLNQFEETLNKVSK